MRGCSSLHEQQLDTRMGQGPGRAGSRRSPVALVGVRGSRWVRVLLAVSANSGLRLDILAFRKAKDGAPVKDR